MAASAAAIAQETFGSAAEALLASAATFADALASGALQGTARPLLLTDPDCPAGGDARGARAAWGSRG